METIETDCNQVQLKHYRNIKHPLKATEQCVLNSETQSTITLRHTTHIKENGVAPSRKTSQALSKLPQMEAMPTGSFTLYPSRFDS